MAKKVFLLGLFCLLLVGAGCFNTTSQQTSTTQETNVQAPEKEAGDDATGKEQSMHSKGRVYAMSNDNPFGRDDELFAIFKENWSDLRGRPYANNVVVDARVIASSLSAKIKVTKPTVKLKGTVAKNVRKVYVIATHNGSRIDRYELKKFVPGVSTTREYNVDTKYSNILPGKNVYFVTAVKDDGTYVVTNPIVVEFEQPVETQIYDGAKEVIFPDNVKDKTKCLLDVCMRKDKKVTKKGQSLVQKWKQKSAYCFEPNASCTENDQTELTVTYTPGVSIEIYARPQIGDLRISVTKVGNFYVKKIEIIGCGGGRLYEVYNQNGTKATIEQVGARPFSVGGLTYVPFNSLSYGFLGFNLPTEEKKIFLSQIKTLKDIVHYENLQNGKKVGILYPELIVQVNNVPVKYVLVGDFAKNGGSRPDMTRRKRYLIIPAREYVFSGFAKRYFSLDTNMRVVNAKGEIVLGMDTIPDPRSYQLQGTRQIEIVKIKNLDDIFLKYAFDDQYILGLKPGYKVDFLAELCKPVVYVYDKKQRQNTLTIHLPQGGYFTHLDPVFTTGTSRVYRPTQSGGVLFASKQFPYLYYSVAVPNYTFEQTGIIVDGKEIEAFFAYVLPRLCFNHQEQKDFVEYRKTEFKPGVLYFVSFKRNEQLTAWIGLTFAQKPETQTRVLLEAYPVKNVEYTPARWKNAVDRLYPAQKCDRSRTFDVFERGGIVVQDNQVTIK